MKPRRKTQYGVYATLDLVRDKNQLPNYSPWNIHEKFDTLDQAMARVKRFIDSWATDQVIAPWEPGGLASVRGLCGSKASIRIEEETVRFGTHTVMSFGYTGRTWLSPTGSAADQWGRDPNRKLGPSYKTYLNAIRAYGLIRREVGESLPQVMLSSDWAKQPESEQTRIVKHLRSMTKELTERVEAKRQRDLELSKPVERPKLSVAEEQYRKELALMRR